MDLNLTPRELEFRGEIRTWLAAHVPQDWAAVQAREEDARKRFAFLRDWQRKMFDAGWVGISWPKEYGGRGAAIVEQVIFTEEMARAGAPPLANGLGIGLIGPAIMAYGTAGQKLRYLPRILSAEEIWCQGFSEPNAGSDVAALTTRAVLDGDHWIVNGQKIWTSYGWIGDWIALVVRTDFDAPKHKGLSYLLVDMTSPGVDARPLRQMTGEAEFSEVFFENVRVPIANTVGKVGQGWEVAVGTLAHERAALGATLVITYKRMFDRLVALAHETPRNGGVAAHDPVIRQKLAQCYAEIEIMRLTQLRTTSRAASGVVPGPEGSLQKLIWSELNQRFQQVAQEVLGPYGQLSKESGYAIDDGQWAYGYLRSRGNTIEAGTSEIQRNIIGHFVLGLPKSY